MMDAKELRIGNCIFSHDVNMNVSIAAGGIEDVEKNPERYNPIPLTPEILEKCGFERQVDENSEDCFYIPISETFLEIRITDKTSWIGEVYLPETKYVHQLQNLYFALTGEELEINL
jgi:hypothetical protein